MNLRVSIIVVNTNLDDKNSEKILQRATMSELNLRKTKLPLAANDSSPQKTHFAKRLYVYYTKLKLLK